MKKHQDLHWIWPFYSQTWGPDNSITIEPEAATTQYGKPCIDFNDAATVDLWAGYKGNPVIAPISGIVQPIEKHAATGKKVLSILTYLNPADPDPKQAGDGTSIMNTFIGITDLNPKLVPGYEVQQGEWLGYTVYAVGSDWPQWVCQAKLPEDTKWSYQLPNEFADKFCAGIDWKNQSSETEWPADSEVYYQGPETPEHLTLPYQQQAAVRRKNNQTMMILLGAAVAAYFLMEKGK